MEPCQTCACVKRFGRASLNSQRFGPNAVKNPAACSSGGGHGLLKIRPRTSAHPPGGAPQQGAKREGDGLSRYQRPRDEPDDFRHRMLANLAAFAFTVALI